MKIKHLTESLNKKYALEEKNVIKKQKSLQESTSNTIKDYSWSKFLDKVEAATGFKVDSAYRRGYNQWIELIDDQGKIRDAEITKYFDGEYELNLSNISTYIHEEYSLVGQDGNAFSLIGYTARCMKECGLRDEINEMRERAMSGDYYNLIAVCDEYIQKCNEINPDINESLNEESQKEVFDKPGEFWYFTKHGIGPGSVPKGIDIEEIIEKDNGEYFLIKDKILSTYALNKYEIKEKSPEDVDEDWEKPNGNFAGWVAIYQGKKIEIPKNEANSLYDAKLKAIEKLKVPKSKVGLLVVQPGYNESFESNSKNVDDMYESFNLKEGKNKNMRQGRLISIINEALNEARNPENDEVNAILKNKIGKARLTKKEQEILDKYGITRDEDGEWIGPNGKRMWKSGKSVYGPTAPGKYHKSRTWELGNQGGYPKNPQHRDSYDEVDFANYLTKEPTDFNYSQPYRGRAVSNKPYETPEMGKVNRPYSDDYKTAKESRDYNQRRANDIDVMSDDEVEKEIDEYRKKLKQSQQSGQKVKDRIQGKADKNQKEIDDIIARAKAKHQKNESLDDKIPEKDVYGRIIDWPDRFTDEEYKLYQKLENKLFDAIVTEAKFIKKHFNLTDGETVEFMENELKMGGGILDILDANLDE